MRWPTRSKTSIRRARSARWVRACGISIRRWITTGSTAGFASRPTSGPSTKMPQFFLNHEHLNNVEKAFTIHDAAGNEQQVTDLEYTQAVRANRNPGAVRNSCSRTASRSSTSASRRASRSSFDGTRQAGCSKRAAAWRATSHDDFPGIHSTKVPTCRGCRRSSIRSKGGSGSTAG